MSHTTYTHKGPFPGKLLLAVQLEPKEIGRRLKAARERKNYTQLSFALEANVSPGTIARWESGGLPPVRELVRIAGLLEIDPADLVEEAPAIDRDEEIRALQEELAGVRGELAAVQKDVRRLVDELLEAPAAAALEDQSQAG